MDSPGDRILYLLKRRQLTKKAFASEIGRSINTITRWTSDNTQKRTKPSEHDLKLVSEYFDVSYEWVRGGSGEGGVSGETVLQSLADYVSGDLIDVIVDDGQPYIRTLLQGVFTIHQSVLSGVTGNHSAQASLYIARTSCMSPKVEPGDKVILEMSGELEAGAVHLFHHDDTGAMLGTLYPTQDAEDGSSHVLIYCSGMPDSVRGFIVNRARLTIFGRAVQVVKMC